MTEIKQSEESRKPISGHPGYFVTNCGKVYGPKGILKQWPTHKGYLRVGMHKKMYVVHRLVFQAFGGDLVEGLQIAHLDGNTTNNNIGNLKQVTAKENMSHQVHHGTRKIRDNHPRAKLKSKDVEYIRANFIKHPGRRSNVTELAVRFGVDRSTIYQIVHMRIWKTTLKKLRERGKG